MRLTSSQLALFWESAAQQRPLVIIGAGRWGRVWTNVAARARGGAEHVVLVARRNHQATVEWSAAESLLDALVVSEALDDAVAGFARAGLPAPLAVVASRPAQHAADARACFDAGLDVLVEKPLVSDPDEARRLLELAADRERILALGVVLAFTPVIHYAVRSMSARPARAALQWSDPVGEFRHGQVKRAHEEIHVLDDILPHAISVLRIIAEPSAPFSLRDARLDSTGDRGAMRFTCAGADFSFDVDRSANARARRIVIETTAGEEWTIDFSTPEGELWIQGVAREVPPEWSKFDSTVRLELGAFVRQCTQRGTRTPVTENLGEYAALHAALRDALG